MTLKKRCSTTPKNLQSNLIYTSLTLDISIDGSEAQSRGGLVAMKGNGFTFDLED